MGNPGSGVAGGPGEAGRGVLPAMVEGRAGPALIAHGGGNTAALAGAAIAERADFVEVDLWLHRGRFEARHERAVYPLPVLFEKWYLRWAPRRPFGLAELLEEAAGRVRVFLDLKGGAEDAARLVRRAIDEAGPKRPRIAASAQQWRILRAIHAVAPEVETFYSIDVQAKLDLFLSVSERDRQPKGVSCRHSLLTAPLVQRLHDRGLWVVAWTVDDLDRAESLAAWGVDGITTHRTAEFRSALLKL
ncbi:MAG: hypothetical protein C0506_09020 [Anaerolinea sp.]|nr:hypothetical protein [Anaerolinea sp.]